MQTRKTRMRQLAGWKECQVRATNVQINVGEVMMMKKKKGEYDVSARAKRKKAQMHWSVRGAGSKHWEIEGLMVWL